MAENPSNPNPEKHPNPENPHRTVEKQEIHTKDSIDSKEFPLVRSDTSHGNIDGVTNKQVSMSLEAEDKEQTNTLIPACIRDEHQAKNNLDLKQSTFVAKNSHCKNTTGKKLKMKPTDMILHDAHAAEGEVKIVISPQEMLQHVQRGDSVVHTSPCAAFISGVGGCRKTESLFGFFSKAINAFGEKDLTPRLEESREGKKDCLLFYRLIILAGDTKKLVWMNFGSTDVTTMFLLSYFVDHYKVRNCELKFTTKPYTPGSNPFEKTVYKMHGRVKQLWDKFPKSVKEIFSTGVTLVNAYDIGPSQAAQDFVPFLNKYCRRSMHLTCYSDTQDDADLGRELDSSRRYFNNLKCSQMFRQLKGCINEEQKVVVTRLEGDTPAPDTCCNKLKREIKARVHTEYVTEVTISNNNEGKTKKAIEFIENLVAKSSFHCTLYLREFLLFQTIKTKCTLDNSFWMEKSEIEKLSKQCNMVNGGLERFLKVFTSFGKVFYAHNIPALDEFVIIDIVKFVEYLHTIYTSGEDKQFSQYGLFPYIDGNENREMSFKFLTVLGLAVKVKLSQLKPLPTKEDKYYCYIPTVKGFDPKYSGNPTQEDFVIISFNEYIAENIQVCLCHDLLVQGAFLIPTRTSDTTLCINEFPEVMITNNGRDAKITIQHQWGLPSNEERIKMYTSILATYPYVTTRSGTRLQYEVKEVPRGFEKESFDKELMNKQKESSYKDSSVIGPLLMATIAPQLSEKYNDNMETLFNVFNTSKKEQKKLKCFRPEMKILVVMVKFFYQSKNEEFEDALIKLGIKRDLIDQNATGEEKDKPAILKEENERLQLQLANKDYDLYHIREQAKDWKKMNLGMTQELENLRKERNGKMCDHCTHGKLNASGTGENKDSFTDKLAILKEEKLMETKKEELLNQQESDFSAAVQSIGTQTLDKHTRDIGVQFNYVPRETDHLQGVNRFKSKLFTITGDQPQSFIWEEFGCEFHVPEGSCPVGSECEVMVDVVTEGDFVFPKKVESVSTIYIISIASKLHQPSLVKIQHCVALDKTNGDSSQLSFYRATLKEPKPPYHFKRVKGKGGRFDINNQYGQLELQEIFCACAMAIGKKSVSSNESTETSSDTEQPQKMTVDTSLLFHGQLFYLEKGLNNWEMKLIVVQCLDAFERYVEAKLSNYEKGVRFIFNFNALSIELILGDGAGNEGWSAKLSVEPCEISYEHAKSFGHSKEVCLPPECLVEVYADMTLPNCTKSLDYPITLQGALALRKEPPRPPKLNVIRILKEKKVKSTVVRSELEPDSKEHNRSPHNAQNYMEVLRKFYGDIRRSINDPVVVSEKILEIKWITFDVHDSNCETADKDSVRQRILKCIRARVQDNPQNLLTLVDKVLASDCSNDILCQNIMKEIAKESDSDTD